MKCRSIMKTMTEIVATSIRRADKQIELHYETI